MAGPIYTSGPSGPGSGGASAPVSTWANLPAAGIIGSRIYISDIGEYGAEFVSNGTVWAHTGEIEIIQKAKGWIVPSLAAADAATYSQTGTVITVTSTGHNIPDLSYNSKDVYLNMGTAATGSTIPPGWFSNFTYVNANTFTCVSTVSQTGTGTVKTNLAETIVPDLNVTILGGVLGLDGKITFSFMPSFNTSAGNKKVTLNYDGTAIVHSNPTSQITSDIFNRHSQNSQVVYYNGNITVLAVDTSVDFNCGFSLLLNAANDYVAIHAASVYISIS